MSVGCAYVWKSLNISVQRSLDIKASTYTAECLALSEALDIALRNPLNNYKILTDSLSVIQSLNSNKSSIQINLYIMAVKDKFCKYINQNNNYGIEFI